MRRMAAFLPLFLFLFGSIAYGTEIYAGSSLFFDFPNCVSMNVSIICSDIIAENEFSVGPNCKITNTTLHNWVWSCNCYDGYRLNITINPASRNNCTFIITYLQDITVPEKVIERHYSSTEVVVHKPQIVSNTTIEKVIQVPVYYENETKIAELNETIQNLTGQLNQMISENEMLREEYQSAKEDYEELLSRFHKIIVVAFITNLVLLLVLIHYKR